MAQKPDVLEKQMDPELKSTPAAPVPASEAAPSAPVASPATAPAGGEGAPTPAPADAERDEQGRFKSSAQDRINELTRKSSESEREAAYWKNLATDKEAPPPPAPPKAPDIKDFANYNDYVDAVSTFKAEQIVEQRLAKRDQESSAKSAAEKAVATYHSREAAVKAAIPDYDAVLSAANTPLETHVGQALFDSEQGPAIAYHLAKNPALLEALNKMSVRQADREIGRLEVLVGKTAGAPAPSPSTSTPASPPTAPAAPVARTTNAPPPAKTVANSGANAPVDLGKLPMAEYVKVRKAQGAKWAR
jgi:hypothetical protein